MHRRKCVLVLDDDRLNRARNTETLLNARYRVLQADTRQEAVTLARAHAPDLTVLRLPASLEDIRLIGRQLEQSRPGRRTPLIIILNQPALSDATRRRKFRYVLSEPCTPGQLLHAVHGQIGDALPRERVLARESHRPSGPSSNGASHRTKTVMVVEDDAETRASLRLFFEHHGYRVVIAEQGDEALRVAREESPRLAIVDLMLPDAPGWELMEELRRAHRDSEMHFISITGHGRNSYAALATQAGSSHHFIKPVPPISLMDRARLLIGDPN